MTAALLDTRTASTPGPGCPVWCTNSAHPCSAESDMCDAGGGDRWHIGRIGSVVLPSRVDEYYDVRIGVELYCYENVGSPIQRSVLITYTCEMQEIGHVPLDLAEARQLINYIRTGPGLADIDKPRQARFGDEAGNNILAERPSPLGSGFVMNVEGHSKRTSMHRTQLESLADNIACACVIVEVTK